MFHRRPPNNCSMIPPAPPPGLSLIDKPASFVYVELSVAQYNCSTPGYVFYYGGEVSLVNDYPSIRPIICCWILGSNRE